MELTLQSPSKKTAFEKDNAVINWKITVAENK